MSITIDFASGWAANSATYTQDDTHSLTVATGSKLLLVAVTEYYNFDVASCTWNGDALSKLDSMTLPDSSDVNGRLEFYYITNPDTGTHDLYTDLASGSSQGYAVIGAYSLKGVNTADPFGTVVKASTNGGASSQTTGAITCTSTDLLVAVMGNKWDNLDSTVGSGQTEKYDYNFFAGCVYGAGSTKPGSNGTTVGWSWTGSAHVAVMVVPVQSAALVPVILSGELT